MLLYVAPGSFETEPVRMGVFAGANALVIENLVYSGGFQERPFIDEAVCHRHLHGGLVASAGKLCRQRLMRLALHGGGQIGRTAVGGLPMVV